LNGRTPEELAASLKGKECCPWCSTLDVIKVTEENQAQIKAMLAEEEKKED
jgi:phage FluMu protein Com